MSHRPMLYRLPCPRGLALAFMALVGSSPLAIARSGSAAVLPAPANGTACRVLSVTTSDKDGGRDVRIHTDGKPQYTVFRLNEPMRVVLDIAGGDVSLVRAPLHVEDGIVGHVAVRQYQAEAAPIGRVIVSFEVDAGYDVRADGADIVLHAQAPGLGSAEGSPIGEASQPGPSPTDTKTPKTPAGADALPGLALGRAFMGSAPPAAVAQAQVVEPLSAAAPAADDPQAAPVPKPSAGPSAPPAVPPKPVPAPLPPSRPAKPRVATLHSIDHHDAGVLLRLSHTPDYTTQRLEHPPRLVVDLNQTRRSSPRMAKPQRTAWASGVRLGDHKSHVRVVFDLRPGQHAEVHRHPQGLWVRPERAEQAATAAAAQDVRPAGPPKVVGLRFSHGMEHERAQTSIELMTHGDAVPRVDTSNAQAWLLEMDGTALAPNLEQARDTSQIPGAVTLISVFQAQRTPPKTHVVVNLAGAAKNALTRIPGGWLWRIESDDAGFVSSMAAPKVAAFVADAPDAPDALEAASLPIEAPPGPDRGRSKRISIDVKDADIINVLRLISEETGENIIASDEVHGKVSLKLRQVPADQALDTLLRTKGFDRVRHNNILRVASAESIQKEREQDLAKRKSLAEVEDTFIKMVTINYATAGEVVDQLKPMLSARGSVQVDARTNTLIMQDVASNVDRLVELARRLDKQTPLVNIQARIVEAQSSYLRDLGVQWGGSSQNTARSGNPTGVYFPGDVTVSGAADATTGNQAQGVTTPARYAVNLPAALENRGGGLGFILGSAGGAHLLDLRLTAMESNGTGKIISSPEVSTLDNKTARVSQGVEIPISVVSAAGTNTRFVPAVLELEVTPHVTNDGTVLLKIKVQKSQPDFSRPGAQGDPTIQKKQAETEVLVRDGDTSVIGGIYTRDTSDSFSEVPFLARIPLLGHLFREHRGQDNRSELLVFITPRIINRDESVVQSGSVLTGAKNAG